MDTSELPGRPATTTVVVRGYRVFYTGSNVCLFLWRILGASLSSSPESIYYVTVVIIIIMRSSLQLRPSCIYVCCMYCHLFKFVLSRVLLMAYSSILLEYVLDSTYS